MADVHQRRCAMHPREPNRAVGNRTTILESGAFWSHPAAAKMHFGRQHTRPGGCTCHWWEI